VSILLQAGGGLAWASPLLLDFDSLADLELVTTQFPPLTFSNATVLTAGMTIEGIKAPLRGRSPASAP
jgi:hypothetical protein